MQSQLNTCMIITTVVACTGNAGHRACMSMCHGHSCSLYHLACMFIVSQGMHVTVSKGMHVTVSQGMHVTVSQGMHVITHVQCRGYYKSTTTNVGLAQCSYLNEGCRS